MSGQVAEEQEYEEVVVEGIEMISEGKNEEKLLNESTWSGFYTHFNIEQPMQIEQLIIFEDCAIGGKGVDDVGPYRLRGQIDCENNFVMSQIYKTHQIEFVGSMDTKYTFMQGNWHICDKQDDEEKSMGEKLNAGGVFQLCLVQDTT